MSDTMTDRIDELVLDGCAFVACTRRLDCDTCPLTELATIARDAEDMVAGHKERIVHEVEKCRSIRVEADKWRKVAEWLSHRLGAKSWMSLTGITRRAIGGDNEDTCDAFVRAEADSQLEAALAAVEQEEAE